MPFITIASGANHGLRYVAEVTPGTTPANPKTTSLTHNSCTLAPSRDTIESGALRDDRMIPFTRTGTDKIAGDIEFELLAGDYDPFLEAALFGTWTDNVLKAGKSAHTFTIERAFTDIGQYGVFTGCYVNQLSLSVKPSAVITGTLGLVGLACAYATSPLDAAPKAPPAPVPFDSFTGTLKEGGTEIAVVTGIELTLNNGVEPQYAVFNRSAAAVSLGRSQLSGTLTAFFTDGALLRKFLDETPAKLEFTLRHGDDAYTFLIPNLTYTGAEHSVQSESSIQLSMPWQANLDAALGTSFQITRNLAASPAPEGV